MSAIVGAESVGEALVLFAKKLSFFVEAMKLKKWDNLELQLAEDFFTGGGKRVVVGIEDDCAVVKVSGFYNLLTLILSGNVHFVLSHFSPFSWKRVCSKFE